MEQRILNRHAAPSKLDTAEYGTIILSLYLKDKDIYLQVSHNPEEPVWEFIMNVPILTTHAKVEEIVNRRLTKTVLESSHGKL